MTLLEQIEEIQGSVFGMTLLEQIEEIQSLMTTLEASLSKHPRRDYQSGFDAAACIWPIEEALMPLKTHIMTMEEEMQSS
jgi:hypothetical protein